MESETLDALIERELICVKDLRACEPVLGFCGSTDYIIAVVHYVGGIVTEGKAIGHAGALIEKLDVRDVVEIYDGAERSSFDKFVGGRVVGREHYFFSGHSRAFRDDKFGERRAIGTGSFVGEDFNDGRIGASLDGEVLTEVGNPIERRLQSLDISTDGRLVVEMERRGIFFNERFELRLGEREIFLHTVDSLFDGLKHLKQVFVFAIPKPLLV